MRRRASNLGQAKLCWLSALTLTARLIRLVAVRADNVVAEQPPPEKHTWEQTGQQEAGRYVRWTGTIIPDVCTEPGRWHMWCVQHTAVCRVLLVSMQVSGCAVCPAAVAPHITRSKSLGGTRSIHLHVTPASTAAVDRRRLPLVG